MQTDKNLISLCEEHQCGTNGAPKSYFFRTLDGSQGHSDTLKTTSGLHDVVISVDDLIGGKEDCWDSNNHCSRIHVFARTCRPTGKYILTWKGGCSQLSFNCHDIQAHGSEVDVDLGNDSDQGNETMQAPGFLDMKMRDGSPVRVRCLQSKKPDFALDSGPYEFVFPKPDTWYHPICIFFFRLYCKLGG